MLAVAVSVGDGFAALITGIAGLVGTGVGVCFPRGENVCAGAGFAIGIGRWELSISGRAMHWGPSAEA